MKQYILAAVAALAGVFGASAQIGYQVAVVNQTTGEPKVNASVSVTVTITDNAGAEITKTTQSATTNDFGVVSLQVGNESTFADTDWSKLPLWISATVDGVSLGKTQILTVPVAEHAKHAGHLTVEKLVGKWSWSDVINGDTNITFNPSGTYTEVHHYDDGYNKEHNVWNGTYEINGDFVLTSEDGKHFNMYYYSPKTGKLYVMGASEEISK